MEIVSVDKFHELIDSLNKEFFFSQYYFWFSTDVLLIIKKGLLWLGKISYSLSGDDEAATKDWYDLYVYNNPNNEKEKHIFITKTDNSQDPSEEPSNCIQEVRYYVYNEE